MSRPVFRRRLAIALAVAAAVLALVLPAAASARTLSSGRAIRAIDGAAAWLASQRQEIDGVRVDYAKRESCVRVNARAVSCWVWLVEYNGGCRNYDRTWLATKVTARLKSPRSAQVVWFSTIPRVYC